MNYKIDLSLEEQLAYEFALRWRDENYGPDLSNIDWLRFKGTPRFCGALMSVASRFSALNPLCNAGDFDFTTFA